MLSSCPAVLGLGERGTLLLCPLQKLPEPLCMCFRQMAARVQGRNDAVDPDAKRPKRAFKNELRDSLTVVSLPTLC